MLLQDPREVDGAHKNNHKQVLLQDPREVDRAHKNNQTNALTRPQRDRRSTQKNHKQMLLQDSREVDRAHKKLMIQGVVAHIGPAKSFVTGRDQDLLLIKIYFDCLIPLKKILDHLIFYQKTWFA